jgi:hypothetical protein
VSQDRAANNRALFPQTAQFVDRMRAIFGADVRLEYAQEGGREIGVREVPGVMVSSDKMVLSKPEIDKKEKR